MYFMNNLIILKHIIYQHIIYNHLLINIDEIINRLKYQVSHNI